MPLTCLPTLNPVSSYSTYPETSPATSPATSSPEAGKENRCESFGDLEEAKLAELLLAELAENDDGEDVVECTSPPSKSLGKKRKADSGHSVGPRPKKARPQPSRELLKTTTYRVPERQPGASVLTSNLPIGPDAVAAHAMGTSGPSWLTTTQRSPEYYNSEMSSDPARNIKKKRRTTEEKQADDDKHKAEMAAKRAAREAKELAIQQAKEQKAAEKAAQKAAKEAARPQKAPARQAPARSTAFVDLTKDDSAVTTAGPQQPRPPLPHPQPARVSHHVSPRPIPGPWSPANQYVQHHPGQQFQPAFPPGFLPTNAGHYVPPPPPPPPAPGASRYNGPPRTLEEMNRRKWQNQQLLMLQQQQQQQYWMPAMPVANWSPPAAVPNWSPPAPVANCSPAVGPPMPPAVLTPSPHESLGEALPASAEQPPNDPLGLELPDLFDDSFWNNIPDLFSEWSDDSHGMALPVLAEEAPADPSPEKLAIEPPVLEQAAPNDFLGDAPPEASGEEPEEAWMKFFDFAAYQAGETTEAEQREEGDDSLFAPMSDEELARALDF